MVSRFYYKVKASPVLSSLLLSLGRCTPRTGYGEARKASPTASERLTFQLSWRLSQIATEVRTAKRLTSTQTLLISSMSPSVSAQYLFCSCCTSFRFHSFPTTSLIIPQFQSPRISVSGCCSQVSSRAQCNDWTLNHDQLILRLHCLVPWTCEVARLIGTET